MGLKKGQAKMSKSDPDSAIFMEDTAADVTRKIKGAFCPLGVVEGNPVLNWCKHIVFPSQDTFTVYRRPEHGGDWYVPAPRCRCGVPYPVPFPLQCVFYVCRVGNHVCSGTAAPRRRKARAGRRPQHVAGTGSGALCVGRASRAASGGAQLFPQTAIDGAPAYLHQYSECHVPGAVLAPVIVLTWWRARFLSYLCCWDHFWDPRAPRIHGVNAFFIFISLPISQALIWSALTNAMTIAGICAVSGVF